MNFWDWCPTQKCVLQIFWHFNVGTFHQVHFCCWGMLLGALGEASFKKNWFFSEKIQTSETPPPPPINLDGQIFSVNRNFGLAETPPPNSKKFWVFSDKIPSFWQNMPKNLIFLLTEILDWVRPPPLLTKNSEKFWVFSDKIPPSWQNMPKNLIFSDKTLLDWVRPPPLLAKNPKNSEFFSVNRNFGFGKTPAPPFRIFSEKTQFFLNDASPKWMEQLLSSLFNKLLGVIYLLLCRTRGKLQHAIARLARCSAQRRKRSWWSSWSKWGRGDHSSLTGTFSPWSENNLHCFIVHPGEW